MLIHNADITGSLLVNGTRFNTGSFSGSFTGIVAGTTATASYVEYNNVANKPALVSGSSQITYSGLTGIPSGIVSGSSQVTYSSLSSIPSGIVSGSSQVTYSGLTGIPSGIVSGSSQVTYSGLSGIPSGILSGSAQIAAFGYATTGSNGFNGNQSITGSLTVTGQVVAQTLNVQQVTSSIVFSSGSNIFGNSISNVQQFTGSISASGSMSITPGITVTGDGSNDMFKAVRAGNTRFVVKNAVNSVGINTDTINNPLTVNGGADFSGNVGIGVTSPNVPLEIQADSGGTAIRIKARASANSGTLRFFDNASSTQLAKVESSDNSFEIGSLNNVFAAFLTNATERMRITSGGNVGIGTTNPGSKLQVEGGEIRATTTNGGVALYRTGDTGEVAAYNWAGSAYLNLNLVGLFHTFSTSGTERMRITSGGNILINQTSALLGVSPTVEMSGVGVVTPTSQASYNVYAWHGTNSTWRGYLQFVKSRGSTIGSYTVVANGDDLGTIRWSGADGSGTVIGAEINAYVDGTPGVNDMPTRLAFLTTADGASSPTERMRITSGGNVGIGLVPTEKLEVNGSLRLSDGNADGPQLKLASSGYSDWNIDNFSGNLRAYYGSTEYLRVTSGGSVQINTTNSPTARLHIADALVSTMLRLRSNNDASTSIIFTSASPGGGSDNYTINHSMIHGSGQGYQISHDVTARWIRMIAGTGGVELAGAATSWTSISDIRKKDVLQTGISNALDKIDSIDAIFYKYKNEELLQDGETLPDGIVEPDQPIKIKQRRIGLIAQQIQEVLPEAVTYNEEEDTYRLSYTEIIPLLVESIKELKAEIQLLKQQ